MATVAAGQVWTLLEVKDLGVGNDYRTARMPPSTPTCSMASWPGGSMMAGIPTRPTSSISSHGQIGKWAAGRDSPPDQSRTVGDQAPNWFGSGRIIARSMIRIDRTATRIAPARSGRN